MTSEPVTREELAKIVNDRLIQFVGQPNTDTTRQSIFEMILSLTKRFPDHIDTIGEIIQEGIHHEST